MGTCEFEALEAKAREHHIAELKAEREIKKQRLRIDDKPKGIYFAFSVIFLLWFIVGCLANLGIHFYVDGWLAHLLWPTIGIVFPVVAFSANFFISGAIETRNKLGPFQEPNFSKMALEEYIVPHLEGQVKQIADELLGPQSELQQNIDQTEASLEQAQALQGKLRAHQEQHGPSANLIEVAEEVSETVRRLEESRNALIEHRNQLKGALHEWRGAIEQIKTPLQEMDLVRQAEEVIRSSEQTIERAEQAITTSLDLLYERVAELRTETLAQIEGAQVLLVAESASSGDARRDLDRIESGLADQQRVRSTAAQRQRT